MNRIILVGNGFDLAHGLKTSYNDFINWYFDKLKRDLSDCMSQTYEDPLCKVKIDAKYNEYEHWSNFMYIHRYLIRDLKNLSLLEYIQSSSHIFVHKSDLLQRILISINSKGWVDIERDYYELLNECPGHHHSLVVELQDQLSFLQEKLVEYLLDIQKSNEINNGLIGGIRDKIYEPVRKCDLTIDAEPEFLKMQLQNKTTPEEVLILDFNYTNTTSMYSNSVIHIHGKLDDPKSIIFGYGDELDEYYKKLSNLNDNRYLTNIKSIRYLENSNYRNLLRFINAAPYQIYIMGHSCGNSDRTLLNTMFEHKNCVSVKPFYYQIDNEHDNYSEITQNISRNFTDMQVFRSRVVDKTKCEPLPQL